MPVIAWLAALLAAVSLHAAGPSRARAAAAKELSAKAAPPAASAAARGAALVAAPPVSAPAAAGSGDQAKSAQATLSALAPEPAPAAPQPLETSGQAAARAFDGLAGSPRGPPALEAIAAGRSGLLRVESVARTLAFLRRGSYPRSEQGDAILAKIRERHPGLPLSSARHFLLREPALLDWLVLPEHAAGAARILADSRGFAKIVLLNAVKPVALDDFVERSIHEAVHLGDMGIFAIPDSDRLLHSVAEGYTQRRAHAMANASLADFGRAQRANTAYVTEISIVEKLLALAGRAALEEVVRRGRSDGLERALGAQWARLRRLSALPVRHSDLSRERLLAVMDRLLDHPEASEADLESAADYVRAAAAR